MPPSYKTFHFWLAFVMGAAGVVNASSVVPVNSQVHMYIGLVISLLGLLAYQLGYQATPSSSANQESNQGGPK